MSFGQEPVVELGDEVSRKQLLAKGETHIYFQANIWIFTALVFVIGILMGIGKAAVYKHIPDYYPNDVGTVGGIVGVLGGLGGFVCPILFGYLLKGTGIWTTTWMFFLTLSVGLLGLDALDHPKDDAQARTGPRPPNRGALGEGKSAERRKMKFDRPVSMRMEKRPSQLYFP